MTVSMSLLNKYSTLRKILKNLWSWVEAHGKVSAMPAQGRVWTSAATWRARYSWSVFVTWCWRCRGGRMPEASRTARRPQWETDRPWWPWLKKKKENPQKYGREHLRLSSGIRGCTRTQTYTCGVIFLLHVVSLPVNSTLRVIQGCKQPGCYLK